MIKTVMIDFSYVGMRAERPDASKSRKCARYAYIQIQILRLRFGGFLISVWSCYFSYSWDKIDGVFEVSFRRIDTAYGGEKPKEYQQVTSNQSITIDNCMMVMLHRSKSFPRLTSFIKGWIWIYLMFMKFLLEGSILLRGVKCPKSSS